MIPVLEGCRIRNRKTMVAGDEGLFYFPYYHSVEWMIGPDDCGFVPSRALEPRNATLMAICSLCGFHVIESFPERMTMKNAHLIEHILRLLTQVLYPQEVCPGGANFGCIWTTAEGIIRR
jgi:hypothetical protein